MPYSPREPRFSGLVGCIGYTRRAQALLRGAHALLVYPIHKKYLMPVYVQTTSKYATHDEEGVLLNV